MQCTEARSICVKPHSYQSSDSNPVGSEQWYIKAWPRPRWSSSDPWWRSRQCLWRLLCGLVS